MIESKIIRIENGYEIIGFLKQSINQNIPNESKGMEINKQIKYECNNPIHYSIREVCSCEP